MTDSDLDIEPLLTKEPSNNSHNNNNNSNIKHNAKKQQKDINRNVMSLPVMERRFSFSRKAQKLRHFWKRKSLFYILAGALLIFLVNLTFNWVSNEDNQMGNEEDVYFLNHIHSHVPGMKVLFNLKSHVKNDSSIVNSPKLSGEVINYIANEVKATVTPSAHQRQRMRDESTELITAKKIRVKNKILNENTSSNGSKSCKQPTDAIIKLKAQKTQNHSKSNLQFNSSQSLFPSSTPIAASSITGNNSVPEGYLVWSEFCKMPNLDPYLPEVMQSFHRKKYKPCKLLPPLTQVEFNRTLQRYILRIDEDVLPGYSKTGKVDCCYQSIIRDGTGSKADSHVSFSECMSFYDGTSLAPTIDNILVKCRSNNKQVYANGHTLMPERPEIRERLNKWKKYDEESGLKEKPPSVLLIGIDSISRINLIRAMPKTARYLYENEWYEMSGFNKVDDNTFPNLMAVLTGMNLSTAERLCSPYKVNALNNCDMIWKTFRDYGYVTAYAEDAASINTFNYLKVGFNETPVDYYLRPFLLGADKHLEDNGKSRKMNCLGYKHEADYVFDYAIEMARRYKNDTFFGLFWANTFSHNDISDCTAMDEHIRDYLQKFKRMGTLDSTIVIFFSDHGMRFGAIRKTYSGHLEERLPFVFLWLPPKIKENYPGFVNALNVNKNRLTNPYDTHMTLKHILSLSGRVKDNSRLSQSSGCSKCQSLLEPVPQNRSCADAAIEPHWCTCLLYENIYKNSKTVVNLTYLLVDYINNYVATYRNQSLTKLCVPLSLDTVESAYHTTQLVNDAEGKTKAQDIYRITFYTKPNKGLFEATAYYDPISGYMKVTGQVSRLNTYILDSDCISDGGAKKYCSCRKKIF